VEPRLSQRERRERAREEILEAAARAIASHGFHGMTMRDLARATGRSLANFYNHFDSKEAVLRELQVGAFGTLIAQGRDLIAQSDDPSAQLYLLIANHVRYVVEHPDVMRVLVHEASALPAKERRQLRTLKERYFELGRAILERLTREVPRQSAAPALDPTELERATYNLFGMMNWIYGWYVPQRHGDARALTRSIHHILLCGVICRCPRTSLQEELEAKLDALERPSPILRLAEGGPA
jgi:AcrR family transcriptional regulator